MNSDIKIKEEKYTQKKWIDYLNNIDIGTTYDNTRYLDNDSTEQEKYMQGLRKFMQDYEKDNSDRLDECYSHYLYATSQTFFEKYYCLKDKKDLKMLLSLCKVMIITANPIEKAILHYDVVQSKKKIIRIIDKYNIYFIFKWNKYWVAHVHQSETGANKDLGASATLYEALQNFDPNVIISLGVAFGIDYKTQNIGDVLVSKRILPYNENKLDEDKLKPDRSQDKTIDKWLHVRLINANGFIEQITYGDILSGESVLSSYKEKNKICSGYTKSDFVIGGEMEGTALFQYANSNRVPGVVIKSVCDWGVAKNSIFPEELAREEKFKDSLQAYAMEQAVNVASLLFADEKLFAESKYTSITKFKISYLLNNLFLFFVAIFMILVGMNDIINSLLGKRIYIERLIQEPAVWICMSISAFFVIFVNLQVWRKIKYKALYRDIEKKTNLQKHDMIQ